MNGIRGWLLVYVIGSIPVMMFHAIGLSGWFFEYPLVLMVAIFLLLASPLLLVLRKSPEAPRWNIAALRIMAVLMTLRAVNVVLWPVGSEGQSPLGSEELPAIVATLSQVVAFSLGWAIVWTQYFKRSVRVRNTCSRPG